MIQALERPTNENIKKLTDKIQTFRKVTIDNMSAL